MSNWALELHTPQVENYGLFAVHDHACAVCRVQKAVLELDKGVFSPCWSCQEQGWTLSRRQRPWWRFW